MTRAKSARRTLTVLLAASLGACATTSQSEPQLTAEEQVLQQAIEAALEPATPEEIALAERSDPLTRANFWADEYRKDAGNLETTIYFLKSLRNLGSHERLIEVASKALPQHPDSYEIYLEIGRSLLAQNKPDEAVRAYVRSADLAPETEAAPLAGLGLAFDRIGEHDKAQEAYQIALDRSPQRVTTLNNYGLSLAITGHIDTAETVLRYAVDLPRSNARVRQNLALVLGLQGKFDDMVTVDPNAPRRTVNANRKALEDMMNPALSYDGLQAFDQSSVMQDAKTEVQDMPEIRHAEIKEDALDEPTGTLATTRPVPPARAQSETSAPLRLKPRLRDYQGG